MKKILLLLALMFPYYLSAMDAKVKKARRKPITTVEIEKKNKEPEAECDRLATQLSSGKLEPWEMKSSIDFSSKLQLDTNQWVFLLGENHVFNKERPKGNLKNRDTATRLMELADEFETEVPALCFLVEHTMQVNNERVVVYGAIPQTILHGLFLHAKKTPYRRSTVKNIEIRDAYCVAKDIMEIEPESAQYKSFEDKQWIQDAIKEYHNYDVLTITWRDLIADFERLCAVC